MEIYVIIFRKNENKIFILMQKYQNFIDFNKIL